MSRTAIVETQTGAILVLDSPILPEGADAHVVELSDAEAAKLGQPGKYTVDAEGVVTVTPPGVDAGAVLRQQILNLAQSSVGVSLDALTAGQRNALTAAMLYLAGGVTQDMKVKPLSEWLT